MTRRLGEVLHGRDNNFNLVRIVAATAVLVSHAWPLTLGEGAAEPLYTATGQTLGYYAVAVFFALSGLLIAKSFDRSPSLARFVIARALRLYPALAAMLLVTVIAGFALTTFDAAAFAGHPATWSYIPRNLSLAFLQYDLPGVFTANPYGPAINGSLTTLVHEVTCYAGVVALGLAGVLRRPCFALATLCAVAAGHGVMLVAGPTAGPWVRLTVLADLAWPFALGAVAYVWRDRLVLSWRLVAAGWAVLLAVWAMTGPGAWLPSAITAMLAYGTVVFGLADTPRLRVYNRLGDYSYGAYVFAFPIQQLAVWVRPGLTPMENIALALPPTLAMAVLSWHLLESPSLARVDSFSSRWADKRRRDGLNISRKAP